MRARLSILLTVILFVITGSRAAFAVGATTWITTSGGTFDWNNTGNWSSGILPSSISDTLITNDLSSSQLITNMGGPLVTATGVISRISSLEMSNGLGSAAITLIQAPGVALVVSNGFQIGKNATLVIVTNATFGTGASGSTLSFNLRAGGQAGTLVLSNAAANSGFSSFINGSIVGSPTNGISNQGTIQFNPNGGQLTSINYGQVGTLTNDALGTVVMNGTGTGAFIGNFGSGNRAFINSGSIFVSAGTLRIDSRDAFSRGGFQNSATGYVQVNSGGVLELRRSANAWGNGPAVTNFGTIFMNGGTLVTFDTDGSGTTNKSRVIANVGTIQGTGKFIASINSLSGSTVVPGMGNFGSLSVAGNVTLGSNSTLTIQLGLLAGQTDLLAVDSNLTLNASSILNLSGGAVGNIYTVATALVVSGTFGSTTPGYTVLYDPTDITVQFIPEPSTLLLVAFGLAGTVALRRRRA